VAHEGLHEDASRLNADTIERHRAWVSAIEELEAIDWYDQRIDATTDEQLRTILTHNRDEEKEHAAMLIAWLAEHDAIFAAELREKLAGEPGETNEQPPPAGDGSLGIGSLRGRAS
jgi:uncharacterized protein